MQENIDQFSNAAILELRNILQAHKTRRLVILVDPALEDGIQAELAPYLNGKQLKKTPLQFLAQDVLPEFTPYLIEIEDEQNLERLVNASVRHAVTEALFAQSNLPAARSICGWFILPTDITCVDLRLALQRCAQLRNQEKTSSLALFRFWDARILQHLPSIFSDKEWQLWLGIPVTWCWINMFGRCQITAFEVDPRSQKRNEPNKTLWQKLKILGTINQCLAYSETYSIKMAQQVNLPLLEQYRKRFEQLLQHANTLGCHDEVEQLTYAVLADELGGYFERHVSMQKLFGDIALGKKTLSIGIANIEQIQWDQITLDLHSTAYTLSTLN